MPRLSNQQIKDLHKDLLKGTESVRTLAKRYGVAPSAIQKHKDKIDIESEQLVQAGVAYKSSLAQIQDPEKVNAIVNAVDERTKHLVFFNTSALKNQQLANNRLKQKENNIDLSELEAHSRITARNKETVLGKSPETAIQINNSTSSDTSVEVLKAIKAKYDTETDSE